MKIITRFRTFLRKNKLEPLWEVFLFSVIIYGFHILYRTTAPYFIRTDVYLAVNHLLSEWVFDQSYFILTRFLGFDLTHEQNTMFFENGGFIGINSSCSGFKQFYQWIVLMILYPGPWKHKLWFIPLGLFIIHLTNLFRIISLAYVVLWWPEQWDFAHDWILRPFFYVVMFFLWVLWNEKFYHKKTKS